MPPALQNVRVIVAPLDLAVGSEVLFGVAGSPTLNLTVGSDGSATSSNQYPAGTVVAVLVTRPGFLPVSTAITLIAGQTDYTVGPLIKSNSDSVAGDIPAELGPGQVSVTSPVPDDGLAIVPQDTVRPPDSYEYIYPSGAFGKYFTASQARMYIGNLFIDELNTVQFTLQGNRIPIYGYASRDFDDMATGRCLIQGQIIINFISEGYLFTVVKEHAKFLKGLQDPPQDDNLMRAQQEFQDLRNTHLMLASARPGRSQVGSNPDGSPMNQAVKDNRLQLVEQRMAQIAALGPNVIDRGRFFQPLPSVYANAVYHTTPFDIELEMEGAGRVVKRRLERCFLTSNDSVIGQDDRVIAESYSFISRRLR